MATQAHLFEDLHAIRERFQQALNSGEGTTCPCCDRYAQKYQRKLHSTVAAQLLMLYRLGGALTYVHARQLVMPGATGVGDFSKAKYWGLIHAADRDEKDAGKCSGWWMLTPTGAAFVRGELTIPRHVYVFDDEVLGKSLNVVSIREALGSKFSYDELIGKARA